MSDPSATPPAAPAPPSTGSGQAAPKPPEVGDLAPDFHLDSSEGGKVRLADFRNKATVVLAFYPGDFTPICTRQLCSYSLAYLEFRRRGCVILGIGVDPVEMHQKFVMSKQISFPLLSDPGGAVCQAYGVYGSILKRPKRALFMIDKQGRVKFKHVEATRLFYKKADAVIELLEKALGGAIA